MRPPFNFDEPPSRQKYFDEESYCFGLWFVFGEYPDGCVAISDANLQGDMFSRVPKEKAQALIQEFQLKPIFQTARMYKGVPPKQDLDKVYGVTTFELG